MSAPLGLGVFLFLLDASDGRILVGYGACAQNIGTLYVIVTRVRL